MPCRRHSCELTNMVVDFLFLLYCLATLVIVVLPLGIWFPALGPLSGYWPVGVLKLVIAAMAMVSFACFRRLLRRDDAPPWRMLLVTSSFFVSLPIVGLACLLLDVLGHWADFAYAIHRHRDGDVLMLEGRAWPLLLLMSIVLAVCLVVMGGVGRRQFCKSQTAYSMTVVCAAVLAIICTILSLGLKPEFVISTVWEDGEWASGQLIEDSMTGGNAIYAGYWHCILFNGVFFYWLLGWGMVGLSAWRGDITQSCGS